MCVQGKMELRVYQFSDAADPWSILEATDKDEMAGHEYTIQVPQGCLVLGQTLNPETQLAIQLNPAKDPARHIRCCPTHRCPQNTVQPSLPAPRRAA